MHVSALLLVLVSAEANWGLVIHTLGSFRELRLCHPGMLFVYSSIMSQEISSPCSACANPSPLCGEQGWGGELSQGPSL